MFSFFQLIACFHRDRQGNLGLVVALALPALLAAVALAVEYSGARSRQAALQAAADSAALAGARQMRLGNASEGLILEIAKAHVSSSLSAAQIDYQFQGKVAQDRTSVKVELRSSDGAGFGAAFGLYPQEKDGGIVIKNGGRLQGTEVGFYFTGDNANLDLKQNSSLSLTAPKTGPMAGLLFFQDRTASEQKFEISSADANLLLGTIYLPNGLLYFGGDKPLAHSSAFTIVVAKRVILSAGPTLVLNSNYSATDTPVPQGVGSMTNELVLKR